MSYAPTLLLWLGLAIQGAGVACLAFSGGFGFGLREPSPRELALGGLTLFCLGCIFFAVYAVLERHFLMTAAQLIAALLISFGVVRKPGDRWSR